MPASPTTPESTDCWKAVRTSDPHFDGRLYCGVTSTGIYCRPSCPARTPKRENVRFFCSTAAARGAGFRACKRCRPDAAPGPHSAGLYTTVDSPIGELLLRGDGEVLTGLYMQEGRTPIRVGRAWCRADEPFAEVKSQLGQYFDGDRTRFDLPLSFVGTPFQRSVWSALRRFPTDRPGATAKSPPLSESHRPQEPSVWPTDAIRSPSSFPAIA